MTLEAHEIAADDKSLIGRMAYCDFVDFRDTDGSEEDLRRALIELNTTMRERLRGQFLISEWRGRREDGTVRIFVLASCRPPS